MGWIGHNIYDGDDTQTIHYNYLKWSKVSSSDDEISEWLRVRGTKIPKDKLHLLKQNQKLLLKKVKVPKYWTEWAALDWQMLLSLFIDNNIKPCKEIYQRGIEATYYLMGEHASDFDNPYYRRLCLKRFMNKARKVYTEQK